MSKAPAIRVRPALVAALFAGVVLTLGAARWARIFQSPMLELGDIAVNALQIDNAKHFSEIYGNYSRFEFNHPGPAFFYVYGTAERLLYDWLHVVPSPTNAHLLGGLALQSLFFALAVAVMGAHVRQPAFAPLALLGGAIYFGLLAEPLVSIWPPHVLLMPFLCFLVTGVSAASGRIESWPLAALSGGFLFHGHVAQPLFVGGLGALALFLSFRRLRAEAGDRWRDVLRAHRVRLAVCATLVAILLAPLVIDVLTRGTRSNIATILGRFLGNAREEISALKGFLYFLSFATPARNQEEIFAVLGPKTRSLFADHAGLIAAWVAVLAVPSFVAWRWRSLLPPEGRRFVLTGGGFIAASVAACVLWGKAQAGGMFHFNGYFYYAIYYFGLLLALALAARGLARVPRWLLGLPVAMAAVVAARLFAAGEPTADTTGLEVQRGVAAALAADPNPRPKLLVFEHVHWHNTAAVALELQRRGVGFYLPPWWNFMFQARHDLTRLGPVPEDQVSIWWIAPPPTGAATLTPELGVHLKPGAIRPTGDEMRFGKGDNGFRHLVSGLTVGNIDFAATNLPRVVLQLSTVAATQAVKVIFDAAAVERGASSPADVFFNGESVGQVAVRERGKASVIVPAALWNRRPVGTLELRFPKAMAHRTRERPDYQWWSAWDLWGIRFETANAPRP